MNYYEDFYDGLRDSKNILYRQIDTVATLNKLLSTINSEIYNLENYKINVVGQGTYETKNYLKELIEIFKDNLEELQLLIKIKNGFPIFQLEDIETISLIKTLPSMDYKSSTITYNIKNEINIITNLINESIISAQKENDYQTIYILEKLLYEINKALLYIQI